MNQKIISIEITPNSDSVLTENGGVMWEHNATSLKFIIDPKLVGDYRYYIEYRSLMGTRVRTEYLDLNTEDNTITYSIPVTMSSLKGVECWFNIVSIDDDGNTQQVIKSAKFCLSFDYSPDTDNRLCKVNDFSINSLLEAIRLGTFKGDKGDKGEKGDKGDKGDKGETGEISKEYAAKNFSNAIKGTVTGAIIAADDVSPIEHQMAVSLSSKNLWQGKSVLETESYFYTQAVNIPASITVSLKKSDDLTLSSGVWRARIKYADDTVKYISDAEIANETYSKTYVATEDNPIVEIVMRADNITAGSYYDIQVEIGETATEYTPYADPSAITLTRCGKNLFENSNLVSGYYDDADFTVTSPTSKIFKSNKLFLPKGTYVLSFNETVTIVRTILNGTFSNKSIIDVQTLLCEVKEDCFVGVSFRKSDSTEWDEASPIQLEVGDTATEFEEYKGETGIRTTDGTCTVTSVSPATTLLTDTAGVIIKCKYNKDTNKVIERLANAIVSLGGNV